MSRLQKMLVVLQKMLVVLMALVLLLGGVNWLVTAIRSWQNDNDVEDLFELINAPQNVSNVLYCVVFVVSLLVSFRMVFPASKQLSM